MKDIPRILGHLERTRQGLESVLATIPAALWQKPPAGGGWSAAEVAAHLIMVERAITQGAAKVLSRPARPVPFWKRLPIPLSTTTWRGYKAKTPIPLDPSLVAPKEEMLAELRAGRKLTLSFLEENRGRDLGAYYWKHPFFGLLNYNEWFMVMGYHATRHSKQIREIVESFHK